nr:MAG TPA: NACHT domain protein [Caudoviricetes sp.]
MPRCLPGRFLVCFTVLWSISFAGENGTGCTELARRVSFRWTIRTACDNV